MTHRKLIEQMLAALDIWTHCDAPEIQAEAITAARAYLAAPEQSELQDAKDTIELLEMRIDQLEAPEPVNQMLLAALKLASVMLKTGTPEYDERDAIEVIEAALAAAQKAKT